MYSFSRSSEDEKFGLYSKEEHLVLHPNTKSVLATVRESNNCDDPLYKSRPNKKDGWGQHDYP